jgi:uncharacterized protein GlcG (DUF336 family)
VRPRRGPAALAVEAATETIAACAKQGYRETAVVLDADGATIVALRGDGAGIHTLDSAHDKAYTSVFSLEKDAPCGRQIERFGDIVAHAILGGLHHRYARI